MNLTLKTSTAILTAFLILATSTAWGLAPGKPSVFLQVSPESQTIPPGESANFTITATPQEGFEGDVRLNVTNLPTGIDATFSPNPVNLPAYTAANSSLMISVGSAVQPGDVMLTITAIGVTDATVNQTANVTITVGAMPPGGINTTTTSTNTTSTSTNTTTTTSLPNTTSTTSTSTTTTTTNTTETTGAGGLGGLSAELTYAAIGIVVIIIIAAIAVAASRRR
jgi:hypothetical protein